MVTIGSILLLLANAVTLRREKLLFNRVTILILLLTGILSYSSLNWEGVLDCLFQSITNIERLHSDYIING